METIQAYLNFNGYSIIFIAIGLIIRFIIGRRRFNRRGIAGLQHFKSYGIALIILWAEWVFRWIANLLIITGLFMLIKW